MKQTLVTYVSICKALFLSIMALCRYNQHHYFLINNLVNQSMLLSDPSGIKS